MERPINQDEMDEFGFLINIVNSKLQQCNPLVKRKITVKKEEKKNGKYIVNLFEKDIEDQRYLTKREIKPFLKGMSFGTEYCHK